MIMRLSWLVLLASMLQACATAPQTAIPVDPQFWQQSQKRVAVIVDDVPDTTVATPGAGCLLCVAVARGIVGGIDKHFKTLQADDLNTLSDAIIGTLRDQQVTAGKLRTPPVIDKLPKFKRSDIPSPSKDFRDFAEKNNVTHILVVDIHQQGISRSFANYVPTEAPHAVVRGEAMLINGATNAYEWYLPIEFTQSATGSWKEPPNYPGLSNAYYQAVARSRDAILSALKR